MIVGATGSTPCRAIWTSAFAPVRRKARSSDHGSCGCVRGTAPGALITSTAGTSVSTIS